MSKTYKITLLPGDGIGPEVMKEAIKVLDVAQKKFDEDSNSAFFAKTIVITGTLPGMSRDEAKDKLLAAGAKVTTSVSAKTDYLLAGDKAGSKLTKAEKLGVQVIDEETMLAMLQK